LNPAAAWGYNRYTISAAAEAAMRRAMLLLGFAALMLSAATAQAERRVALVIGNGAYQHAARLPNPVNDAAAMADLFRRAGFDVVEAQTDLGIIAFKRALRDFGATAASSDVAVVYFAGHGIEARGVNYLIPTDARLARDLDADDEAVSLDRVVSELEPARRLRLVILDACRDNPFVTTMRRSLATRALSRGLAQVEPTTRDTLVAFAAKAGSTADDGSGSHSPFTTALLKHITVPGLDVRLALGRVRDEVFESTRRRQEPFVYGSLGGATVALVATPKAEPAPGPAPAVNPVADARRDYELTERVGTKEAWDSFLAVHKSGFYADLARAARAKLEPASPVAPETQPTVRLGPTPPPGGTAETPPAGAEAPAEQAQKDRVAALPPPADTPPAGPAVLARQLQAELKRVGCYAGAVDGDWGAGSRSALSLYNRHAGAKLDLALASLAAIEAVRGKSTRVCPLTCGRGMRAEGDTCVAIREPATRREPASRREAPPKREAAPERRAPKRAAAPEPRPASRGPASSLCQSFFTGAGGRRCCTYDPPTGAPRIICE
jgi:hypothetical protein